MKLVIHEYIHFPPTLDHRDPPPKKLTISTESTLTINLPRHNLFLNLSALFFLLLYIASQVDLSDVLDGRPSLVLGLGRPLHADGHEDPQNGRRHESVSHEGIRVHAGGGDWEAREGLGSR